MLRSLRDFAAGFTAGQRFFAFIALLAVCLASLVLLASANVLIRTIVLVLCGLLLWFGASVAIPPNPRDDPLRRYSLNIARLLTIPLLGLDGPFSHAATALFRNFAPINSVAEVNIREIYIIPALAIIWGGVVALNWLWRDRTTTGQKSKPITDEFPQRNFLEQLQLVCADIKNDLDRTDAETNWSHAHFVPLEADVDIVGDTNARRRVADLLRAIRQDRISRLFLILGEPGAGKSVALRKLCRDLLAEVKVSGRLPVYVNLKEWRPAKPWTRDNAPDVTQLKEFIRRNLRQRIRMNSGFLNKYFDKMVDYGRIFFILDSFDEIPAILDVDESSWLVRELSAAVTDLLTGGNEARGVLASRYYRRPRLVSTGYRLLQIRPLSEEKVAAAIDRAAPRAALIRQAVFVQRPDLGSVVRNPFLLGLLLSYVDQNDGKLPLSIVDLFRNFVTERLDDASDELAECSMSVEKILLNAEAIAHSMFESGSFGLEIPLAQLEIRLPKREIEVTAQLLASMRIGRISSGTRAFSFVHRRFNEYFLINRFRALPESVPLEAIPADARFRDAIVLYAAIAEPAEARRIVEYCLGVAEPLIAGTVATSNPDYRRGLQSIRFLVDAFQGRLEITGPYAARFGSFVAAHLESDADILLAKNAVEAISLAGPDLAPELTAKALALEDPWLLETAIRGARYLRAMTARAESMILGYFLELSRWELLRGYDGTIRLLALSEYFERIIKRIKAFTLEYIWVSSFSAIEFLLLPSAAPVAFGTALLLQLGNRFFDHEDDVYRPSAHYFHRSNVASGSVFYNVRILFGPFWRCRKRNSALLELADIVCSTVYIAPFFTLIFVIITPFGSGVWSGYVLLLDNLSSGYWGFAVTVLISAVGLPWYSIWCGIKAVAEAYGQSSFKIWGRTLRDFVFAFRWGLAVVGFLIILEFGVFRLMYVFPLLRRLVFWGVGLAFAATGLSVSVIVISRLRLIRRDRLRARQLLEQFDGTRSTISDALKALETTGGRWVFVQGLSKLAVSGTFLKKLTEAENSWPNGKRPNYRDAASSRLAQLDETWLGLDR